jgi:hypothetical protein
MARRVRPTIALAHRPAEARSDASDQAPQFEVLIDPGQAAALAELYQTMQRGADPVALSGESAPDEKPLKVQDVEVRPVAIAELQPLKPIEPAAQEQNGR